MYSPHSIYRFMKSQDFRAVLNIWFYKRHMEDTEKKSPFDTAEEIFLLEYLIKEWYVIASYRNDDNNDIETYLLSTMWHAYLEHYGRSFLFRMRAHVYYYRSIYGVIFASIIGSLIASLIFEKIMRVLI